MPWLTAEYQPVGLFSLKHGEATSTGGKSLLIPTPFAIRMALLDVALRVDGRASSDQAFAVIRSVKIALQPARFAAVSGLFGKILKPARKDDQKKSKAAKVSDSETDAEEDSGDAQKRAMTPTIAFREYVHLWEKFSIAFGGETPSLQTIAHWLPHITYLGKRGGFVQILKLPELQESLPNNYFLLEGINATMQSNAPFSLGLLQRIDEWGESLTFEKANIFEDAKISLGKDRLRADVILPYKLTQSGRGFTLYQIG